MRSYDSTKLLFWKYDMFGVLESQKRSITTHVDQLPESYVLGTPDDVLNTELVPRLRLSVPELDEAAITVSSPREVQIDVSGDFRFGYGSRSIKGAEIVFSVPFTGEMEFFRVRPTHFNLNPPRAIVEHGKLGFPFRSTELIGEQIRREFDGLLKSVKEFLCWQANDVKPFNDSVGNNVTLAITQRREKLRRTHAVVGSLGFPVKG
jgi:hypothetical protein